jgi:hypothetical protein
MRPIGFWIDSLQDTDRIPPQEVVRPLPDDIRTAVGDYLDSGDVVQTYRGHLHCRFACGHSMVHTELSDGRWLWPADLGHYVRDHGVALPQDFVDHVLSGTPHVPESEPDPDYWDRWCWENSSAEYRQRLEQAREAAGLQVQRKLTAAIAQLEAEEGLSEKPCAWAGCTNRALVGRAICAPCCMRGVEEKSIPAEAYGDLRWLLEMYRGTGPRTLEQLIFDVATYEREEDASVLYDALRGCELQVPIDIERKPVESKWGPRFMKRTSVTTTTRMVRDAAGSVWMIALTPMARATAQGDFLGMKWSDLLARVLDMEDAAGLIVQGATTYVMFDKQRARYVLYLESTRKMQ